MMPATDDPGPDGSCRRSSEASSSRIPVTLTPRVLTPFLALSACECKLLRYTFATGETSARSRRQCRQLTNAEAITQCTLCRVQADHAMHARTRLGRTRAQVHARY